MTTRPANPYQSVDAQSAAYADPHRLIQMLMEGALSRIAAGRGALERGETAAKGGELGKAIAIIGGLADGLNLEAGGDIASNLEALYDYMQRRLLEANLQNDPALLDEVMLLMREIKSGWDAIAPTVAAAGAAEAEPLDLRG